MSLYIQLSFAQKYLHCMFHFTVFMVQCAVFIQIPHHNKHTLFPALLYQAPCTSFWCAKMIHILIPSLWVNYFWDSSESWTKVNPDIFPTINNLQNPPGNNRTKLVTVTTNLHNLVVNKKDLNHFLNSLESKPIHLENVRQHHYALWTSRIIQCSKQAPHIIEIQ
jgi:hypothetical protein